MTRIALPCPHPVTLADESPQLRASGLVALNYHFRAGWLPLGKRGHPLQPAGTSPLLDGGHAPATIRDTSPRPHGIHRDSGGKARCRVSVSFDHSRRLKILRNQDTDLSRGLRTRAHSPGGRGHSVRRAPRAPSSARDSLRLLIQTSGQAGAEHGRRAQSKGSARWGDQAAGRWGHGARKGQVAELLPRGGPGTWGPPQPLAQLWALASAPDSRGSGRDAAIEGKYHKMSILPGGQVWPGELSRQAESSLRGTTLPWPRR